MAGMEITHQNSLCDLSRKNNSFHSTEKDKWQVFFASALKAFSKQIEEEQRQGQFITNGGVLYHLALAEKALRCQDNKSEIGQDRLLMFAGLRRVMLEYVRKHYKAVIHMMAHPLNETDVVIAELLDDAGVEHKTIDAMLSDEEIIDSMAAFIGIVPATSASEAIKELNRN